MANNSLPKKVNGLTILLGMGSVGDPSDPVVRFATTESTKAYLSAFAERGYRQLDSARNYPPGSPETAEPLIGEALKLINAEERSGGILKGVPFILDTKLRYKLPNTHRTEMVEKSIQDSLRDFGVNKLNIEYLHSIDETSDTRETCRAMDDALKANKFEHFGLSNASADHIDQFFEACKEQRLTIRPTVYQGHYNILCREIEEKGILEKARSYGMSVYAYSPTGGGLLNSREYRERTGGRFDEKMKMGQISRSLWYTPSLIDAAQALRELSKKHNISGHQLALRWTVWHSGLSGEYNDGIIIGASSIEQLHRNLDDIESGPLPTEVVRDIEEIWSKKVLVG